jgi:hypothetical protein
MGLGKVCHGIADERIARVLQVRLGHLCASAHMFFIKVPIVALESGTSVSEL